MKRIGFLCKAGRPEPVELLRALLPWLRERGCEAVVENEVAAGLGIKGYERERIPDNSDAIVVLGGDGTMLSAARLVGCRNLPIMGVNMGSLGFITLVSMDDIHSALSQVLDGSCPVEDRIMLDATVLSKEGEPCSYTALNDIVINKGALARIVEMETYVQDELLTTYRADGLIISTPTGSTAYSLAAGGPILYPTLESIVVTPICPHMLTNRPMVLPDDRVIKIMLRTLGERVFITVDGQTGQLLRKGDVIEVRKSACTTKIFSPKGHNHFDLLRNKLKWGER